VSEAGSNKRFKGTTRFAGLPLNLVLGPQKPDDDDRCLLAGNLRHGGFSTATASVSDAGVEIALSMARIFGRKSLPNRQTLCLNGSLAPFSEG